MLAITIKQSIHKLEDDHIHLRNKALILTTLDRLMLEHPVQYCKAINPDHYKTMLMKMVKSGMITKDQIQIDE